MLKRIWDILSGLQTAFWLLLSIAAVMYTGSLYATVDYSFYDSLNSMRVQDWFGRYGAGNLLRIWWIPLLFLLFTLLGINTVACTLRRLSVLWRKRKVFSGRDFSILLMPSLIHLIFVGMLSGHLLTFTALHQERVPLKEGGMVTLPDQTSLWVAHISHEFFPEESLLRKRISQSTVKLDRVGDGVREEVRLRFLEPAYVGGYRLHLDMMRKGMRQKLRMPEKLDETCNKANLYHVQKEQKKEPQLNLVITRDPGLMVIIPGFFLLILSLLWYFPQYRRSRSDDGESAL